jgi:dGTPase
MLDRWVGDLIQSTNSQLTDGATLQDVRLNPVRMVGLSFETEIERRQTKEFLYENFYNCSALEPEKEAAERIITGLFELWMKHPEKLPHSYQEKAESEALARVICDYIAGMTDNYIYEQYEKYCE